VDFPHVQTPGIRSGEYNSGDIAFIAGVFHSITVVLHPTWAISLTWVSHIIISNIHDSLAPRPRDNLSKHRAVFGRDFKAGTAPTEQCDANQHGVASLLPTMPDKDSHNGVCTYQSL